MRKNKKVIKMKSYKNKKKNKNKKKIIIFLPILMLTTIICNLGGNTIVSNLNNEVLKLEKELKKEEIKLEQAKAKKYINKSTGEIKEIAKEKLDMNYLTKDQTVYIEVE